VRGARGNSRSYRNHRFADDLGAGIEQPRHDGGVELRHIALEHGRAVGERHAGDRVGILDGDLFAGELAAGRALDAELGGPGAVAVLLALRPRGYLTGGRSSGSASSSR
jgi:hypothetical protein